jgi:hypothetical protein
VDPRPVREFLVGLQAWVSAPVPASRTARGADAFLQTPQSGIEVERNGQGNLLVGPPTAGTPRSSNGQFSPVTGTFQLQQLARTKSNTVPVDAKRTKTAGCHEDSRPKDGPTVACYARHHWQNTTSE